MRSSSRAHRRITSPAALPPLAGVIAIAMALVVLMAWAAMATGAAGFPAWLYRTNPMTAACLAVSGAALCLPRTALPSVAGAARLALGAAVAAVAAIKLSQLVTGQGVSIDLLLFGREIRSLGRTAMAPDTAIALAFLGASLALAPIRRRWAAPASQVFAAVALAIATAGSIFYLYGALKLVAFPGPTAMALQTAVALIILSVGVLWVRPRRGVTGLLTDPAIGGLTARRLVPMIVLVTVGLGGVRIVMARQGILDEVNGVALLVAALLIILVAAVLVLAKDLRAVSRRLAAREAALWRTARQLELARDAAASAAKAKADFIANVSHEIRNPVTAVLGYAKRLARRADLDPAARAEAAGVDSAARALLAVVNDVLEFSRLEEGRVTIRPRPADPAALIAEAAGLFEPQASAKHLGLEVQAGPGLPPRVLIDPDRVRQVLLNLVGNAVKFTAAGSVRVIAGYDLDAGRLRVDVEDTGPGVSEEQRALLFRRFSQIDAAQTQLSGGAGLGLAICKGLVEAMDGDIGVDGRVGGGSVFHISLPAPAAPAEAVTAA